MASNTIDAVILLRWIKIGNPLGVQILEIKNAGVPYNIIK
jgi:hypothetical protein